LIGYARVSTDEQDVTVRREALLSLGVEASRNYVDHGLTGINTNRPGLREALAASRAGDTFIVTKLERLARSVRDVYQIADDLAARAVKLSIGGSVYDPTDPMRKLLFNVLAMVAEFEGDLIRLRTKEGMQIVKAKAAKGKEAETFLPDRKPSWSSCTATVNTPSPSWRNCFR
jgi:DNA invertase Pin-like site-specific DNA recombinase